MSETIRNPSLEMCFKRTLIYKKTLQHEQRKDAAHADDVDGGNMDINVNVSNVILLIR